MRKTVCTAFPEAGNGIAPKSIRLYSCLRNFVPERLVDFRLPQSVLDNCGVLEYRDIVAALVQRRKALGMSQLELDDRAGLQDGYAGKIEGRGRRLGPVSLPLLLGALHVQLMLVSADGQPLRRVTGEPGGVLNLIGRPVLGGSIWAAERVPVAA